jgi:hypothetical protein
MIIKPSEDNQNILELERLLQLHPEKASIINEELRKLRSGQAEENNVAHFLDRECGSSRISVVLNDLRFEYRGQVFQVDHLIINRFLIFTLLETKSAKFGLKVDKRGNFSRSYKGRFSNIPSPIEQVRSQSELLAEYLNGFDLFPRRLGVKLKPFFQSFVTISPKVHFESHPEFDASSIIRYDRIFQDIEAAGYKFNAAGRLLNKVSYETLEEIAQNLCRHHIPKLTDWTSKLQLNAQPEKLQSNAPPCETPISTYPKTCRECSSDLVTIKHGRSYYFSCAACGKNTPVKLPGPGKLRKEGNNFYFSAADGVETLYHRNQ